MTSLLHSLHYKPFGYMREGSLEDKSKVFCNRKVVRIYSSPSSDFRLGCRNSQHRRPRIPVDEVSVYFAGYKVPGNRLLLSLPTAGSRARQWSITQPSPLAIISESA